MSMRDQEKVDMLKARLMADKKSTETKDAESEKRTPNKNTIDSAASVISWVLGFVAVYFSQIALFAKFTSTQPFGFWETLALYYAGNTILKTFLKMIIAFKSK
jgi:hypothetical protein